MDKADHAVCVTDEFLERIKSEKRGNENDRPVKPRSSSYPFATEIFFIKQEHVMYIEHHTTT